MCICEYCWQRFYITQWGLLTKNVILNFSIQNSVFYKCNKSHTLVDSVLHKMYIKVVMNSGSKYHHQ